MQACGRAGDSANSERRVRPCSFRPRQLALCDACVALGSNLLAVIAWLRAMLTDVLVAEFGLLRLGEFSHLFRPLLGQHG